MGGIFQSFVIFLELTADNRQVIPTALKQHIYCNTETSGACVLQRRPYIYIASTLHHPFMGDTVALERPQNQWNINDTTDKPGSPSNKKYSLIADLDRIL